MKMNLNAMRIFVCVHINKCVCFVIVTCWVDTTDFLSNLSLSMRSRSRCVSFKKLSEANLINGIKKHLKWIAKASTSVEKRIMLSLNTVSGRSFARSLAI